MEVAATPTTADYVRAEKLLPHGLKHRVHRAQVRPHTIGDTDRFWYRIVTSKGAEFVLVDPNARLREPAFDHARVAESLGRLLDKTLEPGSLPFSSIHVTDDAVTFAVESESFRWDRAAHELARVEGNGPPDRRHVLSPDRKRAAFRRDGNVWIHDRRSGEEFALTDDAEPDFEYACATQSYNMGQLLAPFGAELPAQLRWSPDSRRLVTIRMDERDLPLLHLVQSSPPDGKRPQLHSSRYALPGDPVATSTLHVFDVEKREAVHAKHPAIRTPIASPFGNGQVWWDRDGSAVYFLELSRGDRDVWLRALDPETGTVRTLVHEADPNHVRVHPLIAQRNVRVVGRGTEVVWWSQRSGWGHLYLVDGTTGKTLNAITQGEWLVRDLVHVDPEERVAYFVGVGVDPDADPYVRQLYRVNLDGSGLRRLTEPPLDHAVTVTRAGGFFVDTASGVATAPAISVLDRTGRTVVELERAETRALDELGVVRPERFSVTAADGVTELWGTLYRPIDFDPKQKYALLDDCYPGPQVNRASPAFLGAEPLARATALPWTALGFAVVQLDGRGTPLRSRAFCDESYGRMEIAGTLADHVAGIRQLGERFPWLDVERVGIYGNSGGGYMSTRAMLEFPDFFKVAVAACGNHDQRMYQASWGETYHSPDVGENYAAQDNTSHAVNLKGKLLLVHGELDDNVYPSLTLRLVDALMAADRDFDLLLVPNAEHTLMKHAHHWQRRRWDYFVRHLLGVEPPEHHLAPFPVDLDVIGELLGR